MCASLSALATGSFCQGLTSSLKTRPGCQGPSGFQVVRSRVAHLTLRGHGAPIVVVSRTGCVGGTVLGSLGVLFGFRVSSQSHTIVLLTKLPRLGQALKLTIRRPLHREVVVGCGLSKLGGRRNHRCVLAGLRKTNYRRAVFRRTTVRTVLGTTSKAPHLVGGLYGTSLLVNSDGGTSLVGSGVIVRTVDSDRLVWPFGKVLPMFGLRVKFPLHVV